MKKDDIIRYTGVTNNTLTHGDEYQVYQVFDEGIRVIIETGFAGITFSDCILVKIGE